MWKTTFKNLFGPLLNILSHVSVSWAFKWALLLRTPPSRNSIGINPYYFSEKKNTEKLSMTSRSSQPVLMKIFLTNKPKFWFKFLKKSISFNCQNGFKVTSKPRLNGAGNSRFDFTSKIFQIPVMNFVIRDYRRRKEVFLRN